MRGFVLFGFLLFLAAVIYRPFIFFGRLPISADTLVGMYHPWRDFLADKFPAGVPFKNFQITDAIRQQYPWRELAVGIFKKGELPLWNPYNFAGMPLLGNLQTASFYPLNFLYWLLPFSYGWGIQIILQTVLGGLFMYAFLKNFKLVNAAAILGALAWTGSGFFTAWQEWNTTVQVALWLPLILLSVDQIFQSAGAKKYILWGSVLAFALTSAFLAGYLQPFFYVVLATILYGFARGFGVWLQQHHSNTRSRAAVIVAAVVILGAFLVAVIATSFQWRETIKLINLSARTVDQANWQRPDWFLPPQNLGQFIAPDYFGNPATLNYFGVWNYQEFVGYIGIIPLFFALLAIFSRRDRKTLFFSLLALAAFLFALPTPLAKIPFQLQLPFISTAQPSRLIMIVDFSLVVLAALGLDYFLSCINDLNHWCRKAYLSIGVLGATIGLLWINTTQLSVAEAVISRRNLLLPAAFIAILAVSLFGLSLFRRHVKLFAFCFLLFAFLDLSRFFLKFNGFSDPHWLYPDTAVTKFLQGKTKDDYSRFMTLDDRIFPPNTNIPYRLLTVNGYDPLYLSRYGELVIASERNRPDASLPWGFNRIIIPKNYESKIMDLLGVKYILSLSDIQSPKLVEVFREGETRVYENRNALPRVFLAKRILPIADKNAALARLWEVDLRDTAVVAAVNNLPAERLATGTAVIGWYSENAVSIKTDADGPAYLVLTDAFYPDWKAYVDGNLTRIYPTDYHFRGVFIPAGEHQIVMKYEPYFNNGN